MLLNLNDPSSIVAWWRLMPERHGPQLMSLMRMWPQFALPLRSAIRRIKADPALRALYERGVKAARDERDDAPHPSYDHDGAVADVNPLAA
jgi:hypothetical protein